MSKDQFNRFITLKALSWKQPYAELMLHGKIETRTWNTNYRGWVLICASKKGYNREDVFGISSTPLLYKINDLVNDHSHNYKKLNEGKAIAIGYLTDCRPMLPEDEDKCFVRYSPNLFCHVYENVHQIEPFDWKGSQRWKEVSEEIKSKIKFI